MEQVPGNADFSAHFKAQKVVLVRCTARATGLHAKALGLNNKLRDRATFSFERTDADGISAMNRGGEAQEQARRAA